MDLTKEIKKLLVDRNMTATQLAEKIGMSQSNLSLKMKNGTYSVADLEKITEELGVKLEINFIAKDNGHVKNR
ncbi:helix-turn-helix transcriptional regulator [Metasolibacillus sp.]|uniref:helix-turn-helix domain-containing protein n=1 Tax=Metasolibacillus sp. TaxID=2703680 RepID=UPI0025DB2180|nr:helix-turn-helix transcriptional regulator [Metasolibacillus sp.]MCT6925417.1 helix-turn-helix transcriptional regulator [Metasolibacillus sp.]MCT6941556.1 helix-turn-helix transcriptional regulator [Metasolibacillus sp.]